MMWRYIARTIGRMLVMLWLVASVSFFVVRALPGNPVDLYIQNLEGTGMSREAARAQAGSVLHLDLDTPLGLQYLSFLGNLIRGDLGESVVLSPGTPVLDMILQRLPWTLFSVGGALVVSFLIGLRLGTRAAYRRGSKFDHLLVNSAAIGDSIPAILVGIVLLFYLGVAWKVIPLDAMRGAYSPTTTPGFNLPFILSALGHAVVPGAVYILTSVGGWALLMRSNAIGVLGEDYVVAAHARGLHPKRIEKTYVRKNARLPLVVGFAITMGFVVSGAVLIEEIFIYPGVGLLLANALGRLDYTVMQGVVIATTVAVLVTMAVADALYGWLDPRLRRGGRG